MIDPLELKKKLEIFNQNRDVSDEKIKYLDFKNSELYVQNVKNITNTQNNKVVESLGTLSLGAIPSGILSRYFIFTFVISIEKIPKNNTKQNIINLEGDNMPSFFINYEKPNKVRIGADINGESVLSPKGLNIEKLKVDGKETDSIICKIIHVTFVSYIGNSDTNNNYYIFNEDNRFNLDNILKNNKIIEDKNRKFSNVNITINNDSSMPFDSKLFDMCYYKLNDNENMKNIDIKLFYNYFKSNKLPIQLKQ